MPKKALSQLEQERAARVAEYNEEVRKCALCTDLIFYKQFTSSDSGCKLCFQVLSRLLLYIV
jgi:hypothetical protein